MLSKSTFPVMGFNSFDGYGWSITEEEFKANVEFCDKELKPYGYTYMCLDFMWSTPGRDTRDNPDQNEFFLPWRNMDRFGRLIPAPDRFPSSIEKCSLQPLAEFLHGRNLKFGLHIMRGVPRQAAAARCVVKGTDGITCDQIISREEGECCSWNNEMYPLDMKKKGAREYIESLIELYDEWEVDLLKADDLSYPYHKEEIEAYSRAIENVGREIVFSTSPGAAPIESGGHISKFANMWRISPDFWDDWAALRDQIENFDRWGKYRTETAFPDGDMFPVSRLSNYGPWESPRYSNFTYEEKRTLLSVWSIMNSPIILGGDLTVMDRKTLELLQNEYITCLDRFARNARITKRTEQCLFIEADIKSAAGKKAVAVVNISDQIAAVEIPADPIVNVWGNTAGFLLPHDTVLLIDSANG